MDFSNNEGNRLPKVDALRGLAAVMVILVHGLSVDFIPGFPKLLGEIFYQGKRGVQLFYIISAFTLFYSFHSRWGERNLLLRFFIRRFFRIAPLYYLAIFIYLVARTIHLAPKPSDFPGLISVLANLFFIHGFNPYWINEVVPGGWSIGVEMPFYVIFPLLVFQIRSLNQAIRWQIGFLALALFLPLNLLQFKGLDVYDHWVDFICMFFPLQLGHFGFGIMLYFLVIEKEKPGIAEQMNSMILIGLCLLFGPELVYYFHNDWPMHDLVLQYGFSMGCFLILYFFLQIPDREDRFLFFRFWGKISFGLYLVNFLGYYLLKNWGLLSPMKGEGTFPAAFNYVLRVFGCLSLSTLMAWLLHYSVEIPGQNLGKYIIRKFT